MHGCFVYQCTFKLSSVSETPSMLLIRNRVNIDSDENTSRIIFIMLSNKIIPAIFTLQTVNDFSLWTTIYSNMEQVFSRQQKVLL